MGLFEEFMHGPSKKQEKAEMAAEERNYNMAMEHMNLQNAHGNQGMDDTITLARQQERQDLLRWQQDLSAEEEKLIYNLKRWVLTSEGWQPQQIVTGTDKLGRPILGIVPPVMNEQGIRHIVDSASPFLSKNMINSNFDTDRVLMILKSTCDDLVTDIAANHTEWNLKFEDFDFVTRIFKNTIISSPFRAWNDGQRRHDRTIAKMVEARTEGMRNDKGKKGLLNAMMNSN